MSTTKTREAASPCTGCGQKTVADLRWPSYALFGICAVLFAWFYAPTFKVWYWEWMKKDSYYSHGILVPFISLFLIWLDRKRLSGMHIRQDIMGYPLVILALLVALAFSLAGGTIIQGLMVPILVAGMITVLLGRAMMKALLFPVFYMYFMTPLPGDILTRLSFRIQVLSTIGATGILKMFGLDAWREGVKIILPNIDVLVGAPCSGFRLMISLFAFAVLFVYLKTGPKWGKALLIALTLPLSVVLNAVRIMMIAVVGEFMGADAMHTFHDWSGYIMLVLAFVALSLLARLVKCQKFNSILSS
ncbi:MAG: exosortase/archaeosortase family protein [Armatimonadota bacterium]